ncbi:hypothetical protein I302_104038 [Kwoniella bestiolae CBS 10118]|uniref:RanBP2-type domain-containing protein n=1 Tax=Kwoniella bestiolae CBS 10118 TaxID=1296100 RepID=A0A1B9GA44_9TREE|nr:hypothetical protein I302_02743 [Kwoniella bestiolae CBS 10118]OCF27893.1 hypothetical protein I302_02743 [Kwoniella bestiolae CBS 10118]
MRQVEGARPRTAEDLQALIRSLTITSSREPISINTTNIPPIAMPPSNEAVGGPGGCPAEEGTTQNSKQSLSTRGPPKPRASSSSFIPSQVFKQDNTQMPLPIGTERKLGLIERTHAQHQSQQGYPITPKSSASAWPQQAITWTENTGPIAPISPTSPDRYRDHSNQQHHKDNLRDYEQQWNYYQVERHPRDMLSSAYYTDDLPRKASTFLPFEDDEMGNPAMSPHSSSAKSASGASRTNHSTSGNEDYNFSDFVSTPGFGGFGVTFGASSYRPPSNVLYSQAHTFSNTGLTTFPGNRPSLEHLTQLYSSAGRRSSDSITEWQRQLKQGQHHQGAELQRRTTVPPHSRHPTYGALVPRTEYGPHTFTSPTHRFATPGPERQSTQEDSALIPRRTAWNVTQYTNTGLLPANWAPGTGFDTGPPPPTPFAPGDWICEQPYCGYHNFQKNPDCRACGHPRPWEVITHQPINSPPLGSVGDWRCDCGYINWRRRALCKSCYPDHPSNRDRSAVSLPNHPAGDINTYGSSDNYSNSYTQRGNSPTHRRRASGTQDRSAWDAFGWLSHATGN